MNYKIEYLLIFLFIVACSQVPSTIELVTTKAPHYRGDTDFHPRSKNPAYTKTHPRVCFDEGHNNLAVEKGFYKPVLELIESDGYEVIHKNERFTTAVLQGCDILYTSAVLGSSDMNDRKAAARSAFTLDELRDITAWVKKGGSLLSMTDHKPMSNSAVTLLEKFWIRGSLYNVRNETHPIAPFTDSGIFAIDESMMNPKSPIVKGRNESERLKKIYFFYGQALHGSPSADGFLRVGKDAKIGGVDEVNVIPAQDFPFAALSLTLKKGRVVAFGDATVFTSKMDLYLNEKTGINREGSDNVQMALNVFHWLSRLTN